MKKKIIGAIALAILVTGCNLNTSSSVPVTGNLTTVSSSSSDVSSEVSSSSNSSTSTSTSQETSSSSTNKDETGTVHSTGTGWLPPI
jgi:cytoskeletal protein RodZ